MKRLFLVLAFGKETVAGITRRTKIAHRILVQIPEADARDQDPNNWIVLAQEWLSRVERYEPHAYIWECRYIGSDNTPIIRLV